MRPVAILVLPALVGFGLTFAPTTYANCAGPASMCLLDGVAESAPFVPYPCDGYEYYPEPWECDDVTTWVVDLDDDPGAGIGRPGTPGDRPDIGKPGRPDRPGGGGGGRGGGGRR
ncbi:hypothetical protein [Mycobacterium sp. SMC-4]|uniref:hypothetical protein n=1 Tax=Mycobacterium sp. SMC-4 TaxID=2857059 RepID=UPI003D0240D8